MSQLRIGFAGTPEFAVPCLQVLLDSGHQVVGVWTQPDRPAGRGRKPQASPVKALAAQAGVPVFQPETLKDPEAQQAMQEQALDLLVVVAYGLLLPSVVLNAPRLGCVNVHASILPRWRGAAPIQRAIEAGDAETGVAIMRMEKGLDTGPVFAEARCPIESQTTASELHDILSRLGADTLADTLPQIARAELLPRPQSSEGVTYAHKLSKAEALVDWQQDAPQIARRVRAFHGFPVAETQWQGKKLRIWQAHAEPDAQSGAQSVLQADQHGSANDAKAPAGTVLSQSALGLRVACAQGVLVITELQFAGKRRVSVSDVNNSYALEGQVFG